MRWVAWLLWLAGFVLVVYDVAFDFGLVLFGFAGFGCYGLFDWLVFWCVSGCWFLPFALVVWVFCSLVCLVLDRYCGFVDCFLVVFSFGYSLVLGVGGCRLGCFCWLCWC